MILDPKRTHAMDQAIAGNRDVAEMLAAYREELMRRGFLREEAFALVCMMQQRIFQGKGGDAGQVQP